jgi:type II secretion system protein H
MRFAAPNRNAFTLVELMVVLTIIAIVTGVMVLEMGGTYEDALLRTNARKLIDVCDAASNQAVATHQAQTLRIDVKSGRFSLQPKAREVNERGAAITQGELDQRIALLIREPQREEESDGPNDVEDSDTPAQMDTIVFYPDGSADGREFLFKDRAGVELLLRINPMTSRVRVIEMAAK